MAWNCVSNCWRFRVFSRKLTKLLPFDKAVSRTLEHCIVWFCVKKSQKAQALQEAPSHHVIMTTYYNHIRIISSCLVGCLVRSRSLSLSSVKRVKTHRDWFVGWSKTSIQYFLFQGRKQVKMAGRRRRKRNPYVMCVRLLACLRCERHHARPPAQEKSKSWVIRRIKTQLIAVYSRVAENSWSLMICMMNTLNHCDSGYTFRSGPVYRPILVLVRDARALLWKFGV